MTPPSDVHCPHCNQPVFRATSAVGGKRLTLDIHPQPEAEGTWHFEWVGVGSSPVLRAFPAGQGTKTLFNIEHYIDHAQLCLGQKKDRGGRAILGMDGLPVSEETLVEGKRLREERKRDE